MRYLFTHCLNKKIFLIIVLTLGNTLTHAQTLETLIQSNHHVAINPPELQLKGKIEPILSPNDSELYKKTFRAQIKGNWKLADALISKIGDRLLMGHVLAQRYLHPTKYRSKYIELKKWMALYPDHPNASRIYKLALKRKPKNWKPPKRPILRVSTKGGVKKPKSPNNTKRLKKRTKSDQRLVRRGKYRFSKALRKGHTLVAKKMIQSNKFNSKLSKVEYDQLRARLAHAYFIDKRYEWAIDWAGGAAKRSGKLVPEAHWTAGLAYWQLNNKTKASFHFSKAADSHFTDGWLHAAAAFWASRALLATDQPEKVTYYLKIASKFPRTFYGILAGTILGNQNSFQWTNPSLKQKYSKKIRGNPYGKRGLGLLQIGQIRLAERELRKLAYSAEKSLRTSLLDFVISRKMASLALAIDRQLHPEGNGPVRAAYPIPFWKPKNGFIVDRALIYALILQESQFNPKAKSWAGARGLMQIMPNTASFVAGDRNYRSSKKRQLYSPDLNISLGQKYIKILLKDKNIKGDLFLMTAAWNGGPGNLKKWLRRIEYKKDPLFFIESIPSRETRNFVEKVLSNFWIYRDQLGQGKPSLFLAAGGRFPIYKPLETFPTEVAETHEKRKQN